MNIMTTALDTARKRLKVMEKDISYLISILTKMELKNVDLSNEHKLVLDSETFIALHGAILNSLGKSQEEYRCLQQAILYRDEA